MSFVPRYVDGSERDGLKPAEVYQRVTLEAG